MFDAEILARVQFAVTVGFHYIYPPLSIGLGVILVIMEGMYLKTGNMLFHKMTRFWVKVFALTFAVGVATGIVMEFEFGTNWSTYSRYVGDVFGSALAAEGIFAFFLESGFLAILVFGWDKVGKKMHFVSTIMVAAGAHLSAVWIVVANSWQQTPAGYHIVGEGMMARAEITDFWALVFNPSSMDRLSHVISGCWLAGAFLVISVAAYYLLKNKHIDFAKQSMKIGIIVALIAALLQLVTGHNSADGVAENQPPKLAAFEGHYETGPADMYIVGWVNDETGEVSGIKIPGMLSWLVHGDAEAPVIGLNDYKPEDRPPVNIVFQAYHIMVAIGMLLIALTVFATVLLFTGKLYTTRWYLKLLVWAVLLPQFANQIGWIAAEVGRQPWIVWELLRTSEGLSKVVTENQIIFSLILFSLIYILLFILFLFLLDRKIKHGPEGLDEIESGYDKQKAVFSGTEK